MRPEDLRLLLVQPIVTDAEEEDSEENILMPMEEEESTLGRPNKWRVQLVQ